MKNLVFTVAIRNDNSINNKLINFSIERSQEYANKCGADFLCIDTNKYFSNYSPTWQRFAMFTEDFKNYDNIMYLDCDLVLTKYCPNIFEIMSDYEQDVFVSIDYETIPARKFTGYFNAGLMALKKSWFNSWDKNLVDEMMLKWNNKSHQDQCCLNEMIKNTRDGYVNLGREWNTMTSEFNNMSIVYGIHYIHFRKKYFNMESIIDYEKIPRKQITDYKIQKFPTWWKLHKFETVLSMEKQYEIDLKKGIL